jgi:hypothetical protein
VSEPVKPALTPISEAQFRAFLIANGHIEPWQETPAEGAFVALPPSDSEAPNALPPGDSEGQ